MYRFFLTLFSNQFAAIAIQSYNRRKIAGSKNLKPGFPLKVNSLLTV